MQNGIKERQFYHSQSPPRCTICWQHETKNIETNPSDLPENRVRDAYVFEVVGINLAGPFYHKGNTKSWTVIFNCVIFRAFHLELVMYLSSPGLILELRRFISTYVRPHVVCSDYGTNFLGTENLLKGWLEEYYRRNLCPAKWMAIPSTHCSLVGLVVGAYSLCYQEAIMAYAWLCLHEIQRDDILVDCEARPWTYLSEDQNDLLALTPAMFIQDIQEVGLLDLDCVDKVNFPRRFWYQPCLWEKLRKRFRVNTWVNSSNIGMRFYVTDDTDWSSCSYWWWQKEEDRLPCGKLSECSQEGTRM